MTFPVYIDFYAENLKVLIWNFNNGISSRTCNGYNDASWFVEPYLLVCMKNCWSGLPGIVRVTIVALIRVTSAPLSGRLEMAINRCPLSSRVICFTPGCSSLNRTCSVRRFQMRMLPDSADTMYLTMGHKELQQETKVNV
jgi:hypothetical protein